MLSLAQRVADLSPVERGVFLSGVDLSVLRWDWGFWGRPEQQVPGGDWDFWLLLTGRGWGKTRTGAEAVRFWEGLGVGRFALVGGTAADVRDTMVEGESGLLSCYPAGLGPLYEPTKTRLTWPRRRVRGWVGSGVVGGSAVAQLYSAERPDRLRGPQQEKAWCDEPASWRFGEETWDNLLLGLRLGERPQAVLTTTPRPVKLILDLVRDPRCHVTRGSTYDNVENLAPLFAEEIIQRYEGTRLGRQEIYAEILFEVEGALFRREWIDGPRWPRVHNADLGLVCVAVDPAVTAGPKSAETGIVAAGSAGVDEYAVIADQSGRYTPDTWAAIAVNLYHELKADCIVGEVNQGGDLVESNLRRVDPTVPFKPVTATRGKMKRAQPVASLYEQRKVHHVGVFAQLEDQMCSFTGDLEQDKSMPSPDRMDAAVWAISWLSSKRRRRWRIV